MLVTIGLGVTQLVPGDDGGWVGAEAAIGGHACVRLLCCRGDAVDRQGIGPWGSGRAGVASVASVT